MVLITGASTGIGSATAAHLDRLGHEVFAGVRKEADGQRLRERSPGVTPVILDVTDGASIAAAAETVGERPLAGLVNNAGIAVSGPLEFMDLDALRHQLEVNLVGQVAVTQAFLPALRRGRGRVVFTGSIGGRVPLPFTAPYGASKAGIAAIAGSLRQELRPWGIGVSVVEPGSVATPIWEKGAGAAASTVAALPPQGRELYGKTLSGTGEIAAKMEAAGIPPERVAEVIERALTVKRPRSRYLVGRDAKMQYVMSRLLPDPLFDRLVAREMGL